MTKKYSEDKADKIIKSLEEIHDLFNKCLEDLSNQQERYREEMQKK